MHCGQTVRRQSAARQWRPAQRHRNIFCSDTTAAAAAAAAAAVQVSRAPARRSRPLHYTLGGGGGGGSARATRSWGGVMRGLLRRPSRPLLGADPEGGQLKPRAFA